MLHGDMNIQAGGGSISVNGVADNSMKLDANDSNIDITDTQSKSIHASSGGGKVNLSYAD